MCRLRDGLAGVFVDRGLGVEAFEMADPAAHHQPDHAPGPGRNNVRVSCALRVKHGPQAQADETHTDVGEKSPAGGQSGAKIM